MTTTLQRPPLPTSAAASAGGAASTSSPEFSFSQQDFEQVRQLIHQRAGISLQPGKQAMVYSRLSRRLRETGHAGFAEYLGWLQAHTGPGSEVEWQEFINCLTTNLTAFFREEHHFHELVRDLQARRGKALRMWCSAASTGEEPYSLAMTAIEALGPKPDVRILASDIDTKVLATAQRGVYDIQARGLSLQRLQQHCQRGTGAKAGFMRIKPEVSRLIEFRSFNLMTPQWSLGEPFDFIFCRNVMIYFDAPTQQQVLRQMHAVLKPGGLLYVGHSENFTDARTLFRLRGKTIYERVG